MSTASKGAFAATIVFFFLLISTIVLVVVWRIRQLRGKREDAAIIDIGEEQSMTTRKRRFSQTEYGGVFKESTVVIQRTRPRCEDTDDQLEDVQIETVTEQVDADPQSVDDVTYQRTTITRERVQN